MKIGIDGNEANIINRVGVGQFAFQVLKHLYQIDKNNEYIIFLKNSPLSDLPPERKNWQYRVFGPNKLWTKIALPFHLFTHKDKLNVFFSPSHYSPAFSPYPTVPTIHDLGYLQYKSQFTNKDLYQLVNWTEKSILKSKHIISVSEFTKNEIHHTYHIPKDKISVCYNGTDNPSHIDPKDTNKVLEKFNIKQNEYLLYLGTLKPSKNIPFLINAFSKIQNKKIKLVIAGKKGWLFNEIFEIVQKLNLENRVIFTDYIEENEKWILYKNTKSLIIPSLYEGFGIPAIEAQKTNTLVLSSNIEPLKEILGDSAYFFNPHNETELINLLDQIDNLTVKENPKKFSWENTAKSILKVLSQV